MEQGSNPSAAGINKRTTKGQQAKYIIKFLHVIKSPRANRECVNDYIDAKEERPCGHALSNFNFGERSAR